MSAKQTFVKLVCDALGERDFDFEQANRLLGMTPNGGWHLPDDSEYQFSVENGLERRGNTEKNTRTGKKEVDK